MKTYTKNLETGKIELHFEKSEYTALTEAQKSDLKSTYLWSNYGKCWVSRAKEPNTYWAIKTAEKLGFTGCEKVGERLSYAEQLERKSERAENRADRYEEYADNAERRAVTLQADFNKYRQDIAWLTQPIIAGHSGSRTFANHRNKVMARYERGMDEYRKSGYFQERAATARATADNAKLSNAIYLDNRIKECNKNLRDYQKRIVTIEENIYKIQQGETLRSSYTGDIITLEGLEERLTDILDRYDAEQDKLNFFEDCMSKIGGVQFSKDNIQVGYIVNMRRWGKCEIIGAGPVNVQYKILTGGAAGLGGVEAYAAIESIVAERQAPQIVNPYNTGDILTQNYMASGTVYKAFQVIKTTDKSVQIQQIEVIDGVPQQNKFKADSKPALRKITKSKYSEFVGVYEGDWQLYKYTA